MTIEQGQYNSLHNITTFPFDSYVKYLEKSLRISMSMKTSHHTITNLIGRED